MVRREQYKRLEQHLRADARPRIEMTFADVARVIGEQLPHSAYQHSAWWGSDPKHTQAVWLDAGYVASPNLRAERVTFTRKSSKELGIPVSRAGNTPARAIATTGREQLHGRVFISYRREETAFPAGWLFDRLAERYGRDQVFKDVDSIQLGDDFVEKITDAVASCRVLLALIGDRWITITDEEGRRRLDDPDDFVRLEIEAALKRNVRVIPILVQGARLPRVDELPPSLAKLVRLQALELSPRFEIGRLLSVLDSKLPAGSPRQVQFHVDTLPDRSAVRDADLPLIIEGRYSGDVGAAARVILEDSYGQYYVQNPEIKLLSDGTWRATNILPGDGIMYVHFVALNDAGKRFFDQMVEHRAFGAFREMPPDSQILRSVRIYRITQR